MFRIFGKVLTVQYVIWLYPSVTVVEGRTGDLARQTFLLGRLTTAFIYLGPEFGLLLDHQDEGVFLMNIRNALVLCLLGVLVYSPADETTTRP